MTYLDTHVTVWLYQGKIKRLSREAARLIDKADHLLISPAVELELSYLHARQKISVPALDMVADLRARIGLAVCDLPFPLVAHEAMALSWTDDPFDRLIVAQAAAKKSTLLSCDGKILENYAHAVW